MKHPIMAFLLAASFTALAGAQVPVPSAGTTEWRFTGDTGAFIDKAGGPGTLEYADGDGGLTDQIDFFMTTQSAGVPDIGGVDTPILKFWYHYPAVMGYVLRPLTGADLTQFTLVYDIYIEASTAATDDYGALWQSRDNFADAELHLEIFSNGFWHDLDFSGLGVGSLAPGTWNFDQWNRIVYVSDFSGGTAKCFVNGLLAFQDVVLDIMPDGTSPGVASQILADQNGDVTHGFLAAFAVADVALSDADVLALGAPSSEGIFDFGVGTNFCISVANSTGSASTITGTGSASISVNALVLTAENLPPQPGIFIAGPAQAQIPFFNGFLCIDPQGLQRFLTVASPVGGSITEVVDYATSAPGGLSVVAGASYNYQRWNRDPAGGGGNANFSDGYEVTHTP
ncbi:MAG: hypothetical protein E2O39_05130 [Planctomycetota bacterium]|nr:MAG: hypothetical protein E2O39_05130 [Planctomycetota bacterium]